MKIDIETNRLHLTGLCMEATSGSSLADCKEEAQRLADTLGCAVAFTHNERTYRVKRRVAARGLRRLTTQPAGG